MTEPKPINIFDITSVDFGLFSVATMDGVEVNTNVDDTNSKMKKK